MGDGVDQEAHWDEGKELTPEVLDSPFHVNHVFWQVVRTYVGLSHFSIKIEDLPEKEREQIDAVIERDREAEVLAAKLASELEKRFHVLGEELEEELEDPEHHSEEGHHQHYFTAATDSHKDSG